MKLLKRDVGRLCLVKWDDIGRVESMIVEVDDNYKSCNVYDFNAHCLHSVDASQVVEKSGYVTPNAILESRIK